MAALLCLVGAAAACGSAKEAREPQSANGRPEEKYANLKLRVNGPSGETIIGDRGTVRKVMDILAHEPDTNAMVEMARSPDYRIETMNADSTVPFDPVVYRLWITPNQDRLEVVRHPIPKYWILPEKDGDALLDILNAPSEGDALQPSSTIRKSNKLPNGEKIAIQPRAAAGTAVEWRKSI
ncbi:hypothetical protein J19TS2_07480 [Cohnella xylanilytica]|nr:hypothetical protein J19TS2_07480 [Cohnella xylanilytica]